LKSYFSNLSFVKDISTRNKH